MKVVKTNNNTPKVTSSDGFPSCKNTGPNSCQVNLSQVAFNESKYWVNRSKRQSGDLWGSRIPAAYRVTTRNPKNPKAEAQMVESKQKS